MNHPNYQGHAPVAMDVLDHGFVALRNISGPTRRTHFEGSLAEPQGKNEFGYFNVHSTDLRSFDADDTDPANAARMSFGQTDAGRTRDQDLKLADYLMRNKHTTPFEMIEVWVEMKMPIFVARQFVRHRTVSINEISGRYVTLPAEWYIPEIVGGKPVNAKQGQTDTLDMETQEWFKAQLDSACFRDYAVYVEAIERGVAAEHARSLLHINHYTHWLWKQDLHNLLHFLALRDHSHAQIESQKYAKAIDTMLRQHLPHSMTLYDKYRRIES